MKTDIISSYMPDCSEGCNQSSMPHCTPAQQSWWGYTGFTLSICLSVCRRHGFRNVTQVCFGISIRNFMCMLFVAMGRSLYIFSDISFKMAAWQPYWIFLFPDSNFSLALNIKAKLQWHITCVYRKGPIDIHYNMIVVFFPRLR